MNFDKNDTAVVFIDPQNEVLSEKGAGVAAWSTRASRKTTPSRTWSASSRLRRRTASRSSYRRTISIRRTRDGNSTDRSKPMKPSNGYFARKGVCVQLDGLRRVGRGLAGALQALHRGRQDRRRRAASASGDRRPTTSFCSFASGGSSKIILGGMLANMCVESHLRELLEQGFEVAVAKDATAAPRHPEWGYGYTAALINFAYLAHAVLTTTEAIKAMASSVG